MWDRPFNKKGLRKNFNIVINEKTRLQSEALGVIANIPIDSNNANEIQRIYLHYLLKFALLAKTLCLASL